MCIRDSNYPAWIEKASGGAYTVAYAYGEIDSPLGGKTTAQWCDAMHVERCESIDALIEKSDCCLLYTSQPAPEAVARAFGGAVRRVQLGFTPLDTTGWEAETVREDDTTLFVRGAGFRDFERRGLMFPVLAHA